MPPEGSLSTTGRAFPAHPRAELYFASASAEECRTRIERCVQRGDGPAILIGGPGMGKTILLNVLGQRLAEQLGVVRIASTQLCTRRALLQAILFELDLPYQKREEGELRLALIKRLQDPQASPRGIALLIDEAQMLPVRLLEELRILSNLDRQGEPLVRLVLAGSASLEEQFASTELEAFNQRIAARCYLSPLNYRETTQYIRAHIGAAGGDPDQLFLPDAIESVFSASDGVPRLVNQLCDRAIIMAVEQGAATIDQQLVQAAWSDLHQLPAPWHTPEPTIAAPESSIVEFGVLSDCEEPSAQLIYEDQQAFEQLATDSFDSAELDSQDQSNEPENKPEWNADAALAEIESAPPLEEFAVSPPQEDEADPQDSQEQEIEVTPDATTLFGDGFDEEEVVIDRFAPLESAYTASTQEVVNADDSDFSALVGSHLAEPLSPLPYEEEPPAAPEASPAAEPPISVYPINADPAQSALQSDAIAEAPVAVETGQIDSDILIIESEPAPLTAEAPSVQRQDYRQLFTNLRQS